MSNWQAFPHDASRYDYAGAALRAHWEQLHRGDREHYPDRNYVQAMLARYPALQHSISDIEQTASGLQQAWRLYHLGRFGEAFEQAEALGPIAVTCAAKSLGMSYRRAWNLVDTMNRCFREPLVATATGSVLRRVQTGQVQLYLTIVLLAVLILLGIAQLIFY